MSRKIPTPPSTPQLYCPTCGSLVDNDLMSDLAEGMTIFCAFCGHKFEYGTYKNRLQKYQKSSKLPSPIPYSELKPGVSHPRSPKLPNQVHSDFKVKNPNRTVAKNLQDTQSKTQAYRIYREIQRANRHEFRRVKKANKKAFSEPRDFSKREYKRIINFNKTRYNQATAENDRVYQIAVLSNATKNPGIISSIERDYRQIQKRNKREYKQIRRKYKQAYKRIQKSNKAKFKKFRRTNRLHFRRVQESNQSHWQNYNLTLNNRYIDFAQFEPEYIPEDEFQRFDPTIYAPIEPEFFKPEELSIPTVPLPSLHIPQFQPPQVKKIKRFDPMTGKPLPSPQVKFDSITGKPLESHEVSDAEKVDQEEEKIGPLPIKMPTSSSSKIRTQIPHSEPAQKQEMHQETEASTLVFNEVYTVLDEDVRSELLELPISEDDRDMIAKSFIYLNRSQQLKYLEEIEGINESTLEDRKELIKVIENLPIPQPQKEFLIDQLHYLNEDEQTQFVSALENSKESATEEVLESELEGVQNAKSEEKSETSGDIGENLNHEQEYWQSQDEKKAEFEDPEIKSLEEERDKLRQLKQEKEMERERKRKTEERQKLEEKRLQRVRELKEKIRQTEEVDSGERTDSSDEKGEEKKKKILDM